jgi:hypothetical protein
MNRMARMTYCALQHSRPNETLDVPKVERMTQTMRPHVATPSNGFLGRAVGVFNASNTRLSRIGTTRRRPQSSDLTRVGIDPSTFPNVTNI